MEKPLLFDSHTHLNDEAFTADLNEIIKEISENSIFVLNCGFDCPSSHLACKIAGTNEKCFSAVGMHPEDADKYCDKTENEFSGLLLLEKCVALGEIGLDYHYEGYNKTVQAETFIRQLQLAARFKKPVSIHSRDAVSDTYEIVKHCINTSYSGVMHSFKQSREMLQKYLDLNMYFGISGPVTFKNATNLRETVKYIPIERLLLETDSPYLSPEPLRGKRNSSLNLRYIAQKVADIKGLAYDEVCAATTENALKLFNIK